MSARQTRSDPRHASASPAGVGDEQACALLEEARLRCEQLTAAADGERERISLEAIHRQLGLAGWVASSELDPARRKMLLTRAHRRSVRPMPYSTAAHGLAEIVVDAEDALADGLLDQDEIDHLRLAHVHLLEAMELLHGHLYPSGPTPSDR